MKSSRMLTGALVVGSVAVASMFAAAPASAATLPLGQKITVVDKYDLQYYNVNPADAVATPVGTGTSTDNWTWRMAQDADVLLSLEETRAAAARLASLTEAARR